MDIHQAFQTAFFAARKASLDGDHHDRVRLALQMIANFIKENTPKENVSAPLAEGEKNE